MRACKEVNVQAAAAAGNGLALNNQGRFDSMVFYIEWGAGTSAGAVQLEEAHDENYAGTWLAIGAPVAWAAALKTDAVHLSGAYGAVRARISTNIVGGTINVRALGTSNT
jgi:hypothetical protein